MVGLTQYFLSGKYCGQTVLECTLWSKPTPDYVDLSFLLTHKRRLPPVQFSFFLLSFYDYLLNEHANRTAHKWGL